MTFRTWRFSTTEAIPGAEESICNLGGDIARWLVERLPHVGVATETKLTQEVSSWVVFAHFGGLSFFVIARQGFEFEEPPQWMVEIEQWPFSLRRLLPSGKRSHRTVAQAVDRVLRESGDISEIRWHRRKDYRAGAFDAWTDAPERT